jgi:hypothetical protein
MSDEHGLAGLLYRADWTRLRLSAEVSDGSTVLVAPGRHYRYQSAEYVTGCDGGRPWELEADADDPDGSVHWISGPEAPLPRLLCPAWLLEDSELQVLGRVRACGRDALDVAMTRRLRRRRGPEPTDDRPAPVRVLVDAELGILLRIAEPRGSGETRVTELVTVDFDPVIDPDLFRPPPGSRIAEGIGEALGGSIGPAWWAVKTAGGLAAGALATWIRYSPFRRPQPPDDGIDLEAAVPPDDPPPELSADGVPAGPPVSDELLHLLHTGGCYEFAATLHEWVGLGALASSVPAAARRAGFGGLGLLMDAIADQPATGHLISRIRIAAQARYQIDHQYQPRRGPVTVACDGERWWQVYSDKIVTGTPKLPHGDLSSGIRELADPSWLLHCRLSGGSTVQVGNRRAYRINAARAKGFKSLVMMFPAAVAVVDADLGVVLRLTSYIGVRPVQRQELRDLTTDVGDFEVVLPDDLPTVEKARPFPF